MSDLVALVWFRADPAHEQACLRALEALAGRIEARFAARARFGWRDEPEKNRRTWLESWEPVRAEQESEFVDALAAEAAALGFDAIAPGGRFVELFRWTGESARAVPPCA